MKVLLVGHVSMDIFDNETRIGGPPTFQTPLFLNWGYEVVVYTSASTNFPFLRHPRLKVHSIPSKYTTTFKFRIKDNGLRELTLLHKASPLPEVLPTDGHFDLAIVSPICGEISPNLLKAIRSRAKMVVGDIQGFIRIKEPDGRITHKETLDCDFFEQTFNIVKGSDEELISPPYNRNFYYVQTRGPKPVIIWKSGEKYEFNIKSVPEQNIVDSTGSGDIFLAAFSHSFLLHGNLKDAVEFGNEMAISNLFRKGPPKLQTRNEG